MRFRKSIRIAKGVRVNFSKSGMSLTAGGRGASVNIGPRGTYLNTGMPGTGLYDRTRIGGSSTSSRSYASSSKSSVDFSITVGIDDNGNYFIKDQYGDIITDETLLRKIKRTDSYKNKVLELSEKFANEKNAETGTFVEIYKMSEKIITEPEIKEKLSNLKPQRYIKNEFTRSKPNEISIKADVESEARRNIRSIAFWTLKKRRQDYVNEEFPLRLQSEVKKYEDDLQEHIKEESRMEIEKNARYDVLYNQEKEYLESFLAGKRELVELSLDSFLQSMTLPVNFEVSYEYDESKGILKVDLDLPEIEDLPTSKATTLASGKVKVKDKTQKEIKEEYLICICGLAFFFSTHFFNLSTHISKILISGFTQRINKKTGQMNDDYVYSIIFDRDKLQRIEIDKITPYLSFGEFEHKISYSKSYELSIIEPIYDVKLET